MTLRLLRKRKTDNSVIGSCLGPEQGGITVTGKGSVADTFYQKKVKEKLEQCKVLCGLLEKFDMIFQLSLALRGLRMRIACISILAPHCQAQRRLLGVCVEISDLQLHIETQLYSYTSLPLSSGPAGRSPCCSQAALLSPIVSAMIVLHGKHGRQQVRPSRRASAAWICFPGVQQTSLPY